MGPSFTHYLPHPGLRARETPALPAQSLANRMNLCPTALTIVSLRRGTSNQGCPPLGFLGVEETQA